MRKSVLFILSLILAGLSGCANSADPIAEGEAARQAVVRLFDALAHIDADAMQETMAEDFRLVEAGEVHTRDEAIAMISSLEGKMAERANTFDFIHTQVEGSLAWTTYRNGAHIMMTDGNVRDVKWLESALLRKSDGVWRVVLLHSTRLESE